MKKLIFLLAIIAIVAYSCGLDGPSTDKPDEFDRSEMLINLADNIIIPSFQDLDVKLAALVIIKNDFTVAPNQQNLEALRTAWLQAYKIWQYVEMLNIGKAEEIQYVLQMNVYPVNTVAVHNNISTGVYDLAHSNNNDAVGFPALDYLLFGIAATDTEILEKYTIADDAAKYNDYLSDLVDQMKILTESVLVDWTTNYRATFITGTENTATSAANKLVNDFIFYYEKGLRANKIGTPAGIYSSTPLPEKMEAYYNRGVSKELALEGLQAVQDFFNGKYYISSSTGAGFYSYLSDLGKSDLANAINEKLDIAREKMQLLNERFYDQINDDNTKMTRTFDALQVVVPLFKVEMLNEFKINIDYIDADGD